MDKAHHIVNESKPVNQLLEDIAAHFFVVKLREDLGEEKSML